MDGPAAGQPSPRRPLPAGVVDEIRRAIVSGRFEPGCRLTEERLAEEFGVSRVPVREALRSLEVEGFVRITPYFGTFVVELSEGEAEDLLEVRAAIEVLAARRAAERRSDDHLAELGEVLEAADRARAAGAFDDLVALNGRFHLLVAEASGNASLHQLLRQLRTKIEWVYAAEVHHRADASWSEHADLLAAIAAGAADDAADVADHHIRNARAAYRRRLSR